MIKVYGILFTQFIFTFELVLITQIIIIKEYLLNKPVLGIVLICFAAVIFLTTFIVFLCNPNKLLQKVQVNYIILTIITVCETIILVYVAIFYSPNYVIGAIAFVIAISIGFFCFSF